ncbi:MAG: Ig-like domain-containing protein [Longimicrobiales bacterium]
MLALLTMAACTDGSGESDGLGAGPGAKGMILELTPEAALLAQTGDRISLAAAVRDARGRRVSAKVDYTSLNPVIAVVDGTGTVTGLNEGLVAIVGASGAAKDTAVIAVAARRLKTGSSSVAVYPSVDTIPEVGGSAELTALARESSGRLLGKGRLEWSSLNSNIASVDKNGVVRGLARGSARIRVTGAGSADTATILVAPDGSGLRLEIAPAEDTIAEVGGKALLSAKVVDGAGAVQPANVSWSSLDGSIATVNSEGVVQGISKGLARIRASSGTLADTARVWVAPTLAPALVVVQPVVDTIGVNATTQLNASVKDLNGRAVTSVAVTWSTTNANIAIVSSTGLVKGLANGTVQIVAQAGPASGMATVVVSSSVPEQQPGTLVLSPQKGTVEVGDTIAMLASVTDSKGALMNSATVSWKSTHPNKGVVDGHGASATVKGIEKGEFGVVAASGAMADTVWLLVAESVSEGEGGDTTAVRVDVTPKVDTIPTAGGTVDLSGRVLDSAGASVDGVVVTWTSLDAAIAAVDNSGRVTALAQGTARIVASYAALRDTAVIHVQPSGITPIPTTMRITPDSVNLPSVGATMMLIAEVRDQTGSVMGGVHPSWSSLDAGVASVNNGVVTAVKAGTAQIVAAWSGVADTAVIVVHSSPPPGPGYTVDLQIVRLRGGPGIALVSNAIPLPPGVLYPGGEANVHVLVNGNEQAIYAEALAGQFPDGSLRSVLVQFHHSVGSSPITAQFVISTGRTTGSPAKVAVNLTLTAPWPEAVALPTDPNYLMSTRIVGPTVGVAEADAFSPLWQQRFHSVGDPMWAYHLSTYLSIDHNLSIDRNYYDRSLAYFAYWVRSGDVEAFKRGIHYAVVYRENYTRLYNYKVQPHNLMLEGEALLYTLLGDEAGRRGVSLTAVYLRDAWLAKLSDPTWHYTANRPMARVLEVFITAIKVDAPSGNWPAELRTALTAFLSHQSPDGGYRYPAQCYMSNNFQTGLFNDALIRYWEEFEQDPRIVTALERNNDWMWNTQWVASGGGFKYSEGPCNLPGAGATTAPAPDLNLLMVNAFGFVYQQTRDVKHRQWGDTAFQEGIKRAWLGNTPAQGNKQFNQQYRSAFRYFLYRR